MPLAESPMFLCLDLVLNLESVLFVVTSSLFSCSSVEDLAFFTLNLPLDLNDCLPRVATFFSSLLTSTKFWESSFAPVSILRPYSVETS